MDALLALIVTWLAINFELPPNYKYPTVSFRPAAEIYRARYGIGETQSFPVVVAVYDERNGAILLPSNWTAVSPADISVLVHEMVHHLQGKAGLKYECAEAREAPEYAAQEKWLNQSGTDLSREFGIDAMTLKLLTKCGIH